MRLRRARRRCSSTSLSLASTANYAACLLGRINVLPATVRNGRAESPLGSLPAPNLADGLAKLLVRPEQLSLIAESGDAVIGPQRFGGSFREVEVSLGGASVLVRMPLSKAVPEGPARIVLEGDAQLIPA